MHVPFLEDLNEFAKYGGKTILEASSYGCNRKMEELIRLADLTDLNIVVGTGIIRSILILINVVENYHVTLLTTQDVSNHRMILRLF